MQSPGNTKFWTEVKKLGIRGGLISDDEASQYGGTSDVTEKQALEVSRRICPINHRRS
jgi:ATP-dependent DNA helicase 2 subunit 2